MTLVIRKETELVLKAERRGGKLTVRFPREIVLPLDDEIFKLEGKIFNTGRIRTADARVRVRVVFETDFGKDIEFVEDWWFIREVEKNPEVARYYDEYRFLSFWHFPWTPEDLKLVRNGGVLIAADTLCLAHHPKTGKSALRTRKETEQVRRLVDLGGLREVREAKGMKLYIPTCPEAEKILEKLLDGEIKTVPKARDIREAHAKLVARLFRRLEESMWRVERITPKLAVLVWEPEGIRLKLWGYDLWINGRYLVSQQGGWKLENVDLEKVLAERPVELQLCTLFKTRETATQWLKRIAEGTVTLEGLVAALKRSLSSPRNMRWAAELIERCDPELAMRFRAHFHAREFRRLEGENAGQGAPVALRELCNKVVRVLP